MKRTDDTVPRSVCGAGPRFVALLAFTFLVSVGPSSDCHAQATNEPAGPFMREDSLVVSPPPKRWDIAVLECGVIHFIPWFVGHYIQDGYWTQISVNSMKINLRHGFEWDPNRFANNFQNHPYHGNAYFNAARTNGMNFWESIPYAFTSSLTWELFMESEFPSASDLIMTTAAGAALGEELYRFSEQLLDDRTRGWERFWRELGATAINPVGGFNRLIRGDMFRKHTVANHIRNPLVGYVALGSRTSIQGTNVDKQKVRPSLAWTLAYGDPHRSKRSRKPYDYFTFRGWVSQGREMAHVTLIQQGMIVGRNFESDDRSRHLLGLFQQYDYVNVELFNYGGMTFAPGLISSWSLGRGWGLRSQIHPGWLMLGGSNNEYFTNTQGRNYNYTWGFKGKVSFTLVSPGLGDLLAEYMYFWMHSVEGIEGTDTIHQLVVDYNKKIFRDLGLGLEYFRYARTGDYPDFPQSTVTVDGVRLLVSYAFY